LFDIISWCIAISSVKRIASASTEIVWNTEPL
jgi:hypothetical protein